MLHPLVRALVAAELPVLARHGIYMWGYVVLNALDGSPARTQAALAQAIGADKTRIIATLDALQRAGLITREPDPADRRGRLLAITAAGRQVRTAAQRLGLVVRKPQGHRHAFMVSPMIPNVRLPESSAGTTRSA